MRSAIEPGSRTDAIPPWLQVAIAAGVALPMLSFGREFFVPLAIALLLFVLVVAIDERSRRLTFMGLVLPRWLSRLISLAIVLGAMGAVVRVIADQVGVIAAAAPDYANHVAERIDDLAPILGEGAAGDLRQRLAEFDPNAALSALIPPAGTFLSTGLLVFFYLLFMLAEREAFTRKLPRVVGSSERAAETQKAARTISRLVERYMWVNTVSSAMAGLVLYAILRATGTDFAAPLAILIFFTAFIPTIGTVFGIAVPALVALLQFGVAWQFWVVLALGGVLRLFIDNVIETALAGRSMNLSAMAVMLSLAFWGGIWGLAGAFLSVPLTVVAAITCAHVPGLRPVAALLSSDGRVPGDDEFSGPGVL